MSTLRNNVEIFNSAYFEWSAIITFGAECFMEHYKYRGHKYTCNLLISLIFWLKQERFETVSGTKY